MTIPDEAFACEEHLLPNDRMRRIRLYNAGRNVCIAPVRRRLFRLDLEREFMACSMPQQHADRG